MAEENKIILDADVKPLKKQLKEATLELQNARERFGELSDEAVTAAKKVAGIRDSIEGANEQASLFDPGKRFQALTSAASLAAGAVGAVQGAMGLFGAESEDVQKALLKVQSAMALSQGLSQLADLGKITDELKSSFKGLIGTTAQKVAATTADTAAVGANAAANVAQATAVTGSTLATKAATIGLKLLRVALISTGIGALVIGLVMLITNFDKVKAAVLNFIPGLGKMADFFGNIIQKVTDFVGVTSEAGRELDKLSKANEKSVEAISNKIKLLTAQGGKETEIYELKRKQINDELNLLKKTAEVEGELNAEQQKRQRELLTENAVEATNFYKQQGEAAKAAADKAKAASDKAKTEQEKINAEKLTAEKILSDAKVSLLEKEEQEKIAIQETFDEQSKKLKDAGIKDDGTLEQVRQKAIADIDKKYKDEKIAKDAEFEQKLNQITTEIRLQGIKDENEKARAELLIEQEKKLEEIEADTTLEEDQKLAIKSQLAIRNKQQLDALELTFAEADAAKELEGLDKEIAKAGISLQMEKDLLDEKERLLKDQFNRKVINEKEYNNEVADLTAARITLGNKEQEAKEKILEAVKQSFAIAADVIGKDTKAGKALGVASATINTFQGISAGVKLGFPAAIPAVAAAAATGFAAVKNILAVKVPGGGGGPSAPSISGTAPAVTSAVPTIGTSPVTALGTMMQNQPPIRAYVVESEVTGTQKRVADIERRAGF